MSVHHNSSNHIGIVDGIAKMTIVVQFVCRETQEKIKPWNKIINDDGNLCTNEMWVMLKKYCIESLALPTFSFTCLIAISK